MKKSRPIAKPKTEEPIKQAPHALVEPPKVDVKVEPVIEVNTPAPDMAPIAEALREAVSKPPPNITVNVPEIEREKRIFEAEITERDTRGYMKKFRFYEL